MPLINRRFARRRALDPELAERVPPGQHVVGDFPVLTVGATPHTSVDVLLHGVEISARYVVARSDAGYTTSLPRADVTDGKAWIVYGYDGKPLAREHGGPARLLVPDLREERYRGD